MRLIFYSKSTKLLVFQEWMDIYSKDTFGTLWHMNWCETSKSKKFYMVWLFIDHLCYIATENHRALLPFILGGNSIHLVVLDKDK